MWFYCNLCRYPDKSAFILRISIGIYFQIVLYALPPTHLILTYAVSLCSNVDHNE